MKFIEITEDSGVGRIAQERLRQVQEEGWTPDHDDEHKNGQMALAGALYATPVAMYQEYRHARGVSFADAWPWDEKWDKRDKGSRLRNLEKAGALIAAEIDRLLRGSEE